MDLNPPSPSKRQCSDGEELLRSSEIWHSDGSVVLQAGCTQFRVHWGVLSLHSSFFQDLQGLPQPPDEPKVDGCPVIEVSDSAKDVEVVLKTLYNPSKPLPLSAVASYTRLSRKYDFKQLLQTMVERLTYENPTTLNAYDLLIKENGYIPTWITPYSGFLIDMVNLAKENNMLALLPCAYLRTDVFEGIRRPDGTLAILSATDQRLCVVAHAAISRAQWITGNTWGWIADNITAVENCKAPTQCRNRKSACFHASIIAGALSPFPNTKMMDKIKICTVCAENGRTRLLEGREKMWQALPSYFELPAWGDLKNDP
ncbi:hypothetical protein FB45DRAFT_767736 [Roridomyces roridus]|uniref:BTB domain-containing protein n=1 Tax=Roridomyces roridus TaxID=1738132 RepID=A0AAD7AZA5_9AGAR|nr:hypothetical protein FB45DRAFT_767736 [Roridomyces roridus]